MEDIGNVPNVVQKTWEMLSPISNRRIPLDSGKFPVELLGPKTLQEFHSTLEMIPWQKF